METGEILDLRLKVQVKNQERKQEPTAGNPVRFRNRHLRVQPMTHSPLHIQVDRGPEMPRRSKNLGFMFYFIIFYRKIGKKPYNWRLGMTDEPVSNVMICHDYLVIEILTKPPICVMIKSQSLLQVEDLAGIIIRLMQTADPGRNRWRISEH